MRWYLVIVLLTLCACKQPSSEPAPTAVPVDPRSQYELVTELRAALRQGEDRALVALQNRWNGRVFEWEMFWIPSLCQSPQRCNLAPFDHRRFDEVVVQGWLPSADLAPEQHQRLLTSCVGSQGCVVTLKGRLEVDISLDEPTSVRLREAQVLSTRVARDDESWIRRNMQARTQ